MDEETRKRVALLEKYANAEGIVILDKSRSILFISPNIRLEVNCDYRTDSKNRQQY